MKGGCHQGKYIDILGMLSLPTFGSDLEYDKPKPLKKMLKYMLSTCWDIMSEKFCVIHFCKKLCRSKDRQGCVLLVDTKCLKHT